MTAEEMLAAYLNDAGETLMHFNEKHDAKGKTADKEDWDRYIRSNTNYDRIM